MIHFIINPSSQSGRAKKLWDVLRRQLDQTDILYDSYLTSGFQETVSYVSRITSNSEEAVHHLAVLGGDGTMNEVINGIIDRDNTYVTYLPTGSGNDLARSLGIVKVDEPEQMIKRLTAPRAMRTIDIGQVEGKGEDGIWMRRLFAISSGIGFDAASCAVSLRSPVKKLLNFLRLGRLTYLINALYCLFHLPDCGVHVTLDEKFSVQRSRFLFCVAMSQPYEGGGFPFCPSSNDQDGLLDVCLVHGIRKRHATYLLPLAALGRHVNSRFVQRYRAKCIDIRTTMPLYVHGDGEVLGEFRDVRISVPEDGKIKFCL